MYFQLQRKEKSLWMPGWLPPQSRCARLYVGDMARKLLKKLDNLEMEVNKLAPEIVMKATPYINALERLEAVRVACFGQLVVEGYADKIKEFSVCYRSLNISIPLKVGCGFN